MQINSILEVSGPGLPDVHFDEMELEDQRNAMAYLYAALTRALKEDLEGAMIDVLTEWYDEVFTILMQTDDRFRERFYEGVIWPPGGRAVRAKYLALAEKASES